MDLDKHQHHVDNETITTDLFSSSRSKSFEELIDASDIDQINSHSTNDDIEAHGAMQAIPIRYSSSPQTYWPQSYREATQAYSLATSPKPCLLGSSIKKRAFSSTSLSKSVSEDVPDDACDDIPDDVSVLLPQPTTPSGTEHNHVDDHSTPLLSYHSNGSIPLPSSKSVMDSKKVGIVRSVTEHNGADDHSMPLLSNYSNGSIRLPSSVIVEDNLPPQYDQGCTLMQAVFHGVNVMAGVGLLSTPYAVREGGWLGLLSLAMFGVVCCYTGHLLRKCMDYRCDSQLLTYPDIIQLAFGKIGRAIVSILLYAELYSFCVEFIILEGDNLHKLFPSAHLGGLHFGSSTIFSLLATLVILPTVWLQDLSYLAYLSAGGVLVTIVVLISVLWVGFANGVGFTRSGPLIVWQKLPLSVGVYGFCFSGHAVFPDIYASMRKKSTYTAVLILSFTFCTIFYTSMAVAGFTMFGEQTCSQITLNLPKEYIASKVALFTTVLNPFTKFALIVAPIGMGLEELLPTRSLSPCCKRALTITVRTFLVISILCVAALVPLFGYLMSLIGSVLSMLVAVILPCVCFLVIYRSRATMFEVVACVVIITIGVTTSIAGTYSSIMGISSEL